MKPPIYSVINDVQEDARKRLLVISERGSCVGAKNTNFYGSDERETTVVPKDVRELCESCPVISECLDYALRYERYNIWANTTERERKMLRTMWGFRLIDPWVRQLHQQGPKTQKDIKIKHGTYTGYKQELRLGVVPCEQCLAANALSAANARARKLNEQTQETTTPLNETTNE